MDGSETDSPDTFWAAGGRAGLFPGCWGWEKLGVGEKGACTRPAGAFAESLGCPGKFAAAPGWGVGQTAARL